jgi:hypothetical protein
MSPLAWVAMLVFEGILLATLPHVRRLWRDEPSRFDDRPARWQRTIPFLLGSGVFLLPLVMATAAFGDTERATPVSAVLVAAVLGLLVVGPAVSLLLWRRGKPERLVPPHLRGVPGDEVRRRRRQRSTRTSGPAAPRNTAR